jgi:predicted deacylase
MLLALEVYTTDGKENQRRQYIEVGQIEQIKPAKKGAKVIMASGNEINTVETMEGVRTLIQRLPESA